MRIFVSTSLLLLAACSAAPPASVEPAPGPPASAGDEAPPANVEHAEPSPAARIVVRLEAHLADLRAAPRELSGDEAFALSSAIMDAIDAQSPPDALRVRADQAAEAILTDRSAEGAVRAAEHALEVMREVVGAEDAPPVEDSNVERPRT